MIPHQLQTPIRLNARQWPRVGDANWGWGWSRCTWVYADGMWCTHRGEEIVLMMDRQVRVCTDHAHFLCKAYGALANPLKHVNGTVDLRRPWGNRKEARDHLRWLRASGRPIR